VLVIVSYNISGWRSFASILKNPKSDVIVLWVTFLRTVIFDITIAIEVGLICACLLFMRRMAETTDVKYISREINPDEEESDFLQGNLEHLVIPKGVEVYEINGPYFFGAGNKFEEIMGALHHERPRVRIIRMRKVPFVDSTGIHNLTNLCLMSQGEGIQVVLSGVNPRVQQVLHKARFDTLLGEKNICSHITLALERAKELL
jgi:SulP family sulfate permease